MSDDERVSEGFELLPPIRDYPEDAAHIPVQLASGGLYRTAEGELVAVTFTDEDDAAASGAVSERPADA